MILAMSRLVALAIVATTGALAGIDTAAAQSKAKAKSKPTPTCMTRLDGTGTGTGALGAGTRNARAAAIADFQQHATSRFGLRYANFQRARGAKWDCKSGPFQAKCVVTALPCR